MSLKSQLAAHHTHGLATSISSAECLPQPPIPISVGLSCFISPPFTCTSFLPSVLFPFHSTQMLQVRHSAHLHLFYLLHRGHLCWRGSNQVKQGCTGDRNWGSSFSASFVEMGCTGVQLAAGQLCCSSDPWRLGIDRSIYLSIYLSSIYLTHQWWELKQTLPCWCCAPRQCPSRTHRQWHRRII